MEKIFKFTKTSLRKRNSGTFTNKDPKIVKANNDMHYVILCSDTYIHNSPLQPFSQDY